MTMLPTAVKSEKANAPKEKKFLQCLQLCHQGEFHHIRISAGDDNSKARVSQGFPRKCAANKSQRERSNNMAADEKTITY